MQEIPFFKILAKSESDRAFWRVNSSIRARVGCDKTDRISSVDVGEDGIIVPNYGPHKRIFDIARLRRFANCVLVTLTNAI